MLKDTNDGAVTASSSSSGSNQTSTRTGSVIAACIERFRHHKPTSPTTRQRIAARDDFFWQEEQRRQQHGQQDDNVTVVRLPTFPVDDDEWSFQAEGDSWKDNGVQSSLQSKLSEMDNTNDIHDVVMEQPPPRGPGIESVHRLDEYANNLLKKCDVLLHGFEQDDVNNNNIKKTTTTTTTKTTHRSGGMTSRHAIRISTDSMGGDISIDSSSSSDHDNGSSEFPDINDQEGEDTEDDFTYSATFTTTAATTLPILETAVSSSSSSSSAVKHQQQQSPLLPETVLPKKSYMTLEELQNLRESECNQEDISNNSSLFAARSEDQLPLATAMTHPPIVVSESTEFLFPAKHRLPNYSQDRDMDKGSEGGFYKDNQGSDKDKSSDNLDDRMTKEEPTTTAADVTSIDAAAAAAVAVIATTTAITTTTSTTTEPLSSDLNTGSDNDKDKGSDNDKDKGSDSEKSSDKDNDKDKGSDKDVLLAPLDASLSSVDLLMFAAAAGKNNRTDMRGLGSGNLYLSSSSEFERYTEGAISEGLRSVGDSCEFEYSLPAPPVKSPVKSSSQIAISPSNLIGDDLNVEPYLFDPVVQHLWSRLCHVREEMSRYDQQ